jgi:hypothetical protein
LGLFYALNERDAGAKVKGRAQREKRKDSIFGVFCVINPKIWNIVCLNLFNYNEL